MRTIIKNSYLFIILMLTMVISAQDFEAQLNLQYNKKIDYKREVYDRIQEMISENPAADELDKLYFNLAELSVEIDRNNPQRIATYYKQVLKYNRDFLYKDIVLYNIAYYSYKAILLKNGQSLQRSAMGISDSLRFSQEMFSEPIYNYKRLIEEHPLSDYYLESAWRLAEIYFSIAEDNNSKVAYLRALDYYDLALKDKSSPFYYYSLSGKARVKHDLLEKDEAYQIEINLLNQLDSLPDFSNQRILVEEITGDMGWFFYLEDDLEFSDVSKTFARIGIRLKDIRNEEITIKILLAVAEQLTKSDQPQLALQYYDKIIETYPTMTNAPMVEAAKLDIYIKYPEMFGGEEETREKVADLEKQVLGDYNSESNWYIENKDREILDSVEFIRGILEKTERTRYNEFIQNSTKNNYLRYRRLVTDYSGFEEFKSNESVRKQNEFQKNLVYMSQLLAQSLNLAEDYQYAIRDLQDYNDHYPLHEDRIDFEKNIFYCYEKLLHFSKTDSLSSDIDTLYIASSKRYEEIMRNDPDWESRQSELARIVFKRAEFLYDHNKLSEASEDFLKVTELKAEREIISAAYRRMAEIALSQNNHHLAEVYLRQAMDYTTGYAQTEVYENIIAVIEQKSQQLLQAKEYEDSAAELMRLSFEIEALYPQKSLSYLKQAVDIYENLGADNKIEEILGIISERENMDQIVSVYEDTWSEADRLEDFKRSIELRQDFVDKYPESHEAFKAELQIIDIYENQLNKKREAAELYLQLHNRYSQYNSINDSPENIFLNALRIYQDLEDDKKCREITEKFLGLYPDYSLIDLNLTYSDTDDYRTSIRKLKQLKAQTKAMFLNEEYEALRSNIDQFRQIGAAINTDTLQIDLSEDNLLFDKFLEYADYHHSLKTAINEIEFNFLDLKPQQLIPVDYATRWKEDIVGKGNSIELLQEQCENYRNAILLILQDGNNYNLSIPDYTHAIWAIAACYDHAYKAVDQQIKNFVVKSDQVNRPELKDNKYLQSELKRRLIAEGQELSFDFKLAAAEFYQNLLYQFYDSGAYSDLWTRRALSRLNEWGIRDAGGAIVMLDESMLMAEESYANEEIEKDYNQIYSEYQNRNYSSAHIKFMNFIKSYPGHRLTYEALYFAGECLYNMGQLAEAKTMFEKVIDFGRDKTPDALLRLGYCYNSIGMTAEAHAAWNQLISDYPDHYLAEVIKLTFDQIAQKESDQEAITPVKQRQNAVLQYRKNVQNYKQGRYSAAKKGFVSVQTNYPDHPLAYSSLFMEAESEYKLGNYQEAFKLYERVAEIKGNKIVNSLYKLGLCAEKTGNLDQQDYYWKRLAEEYPDHYLTNLILQGKSVSVAQTSKIRKSRPAETRVKTRIDSSQYIYKKALMKYRYGDYKAAIEGFEQFYKAYPQHRLAFNAQIIIAESYQKDDRPAKALQLYQKLLSVSGAQRPKVMLAIAENLITLNRISEAKEILQEIKITYAATFDAAQAVKILKQLPGENKNEE